MLLDCVKNKKEWKELLEKYFNNFYDIYFHPDYVAMNCFKKNSRGHLFYYKEDNKIWVYIFNKIKVPNFFNSNTYYDLETPYGYGGPISNSEDIKFILKANEAFKCWIKSNNIVAEFIRFHPIYMNEKYRNDISILSDRKTCGIYLRDLTIDLSFFKPKQRNLIKTSQKKLNISFENSILSFKKFQEAYLNLMIFKKANKELFFTERYFNDLFRLVQKNGFICHITDEKRKDVCFGVFLYSKKIIHYHLSASVPENYIPGSTNLMIWKSALVAKKENKLLLHLGGGNTQKENDSLLKFKTSMSNIEFIYTIGKKIHNNNFYIKNKEIWKIKNPELAKVFSNYVLCYHFDSEIL